ncbi:MAG: flagellar biosynthetic protein FliQ [Deltaproteobacteria bacterium]|nr:flagellar biosynthetic protein FliQ [Deltaproteobacteria bacterium]
MMSATVLDVWRAALTNCAMVTAPYIIVALIVGLMASVFQAMTQIQENIVAFAPKVIAVGLVLALAGNWTLDIMTTFLREVTVLMTEIGHNVGPH